ncbi:MAG: hypothetical protein KDC66_09755 [Phaeodactylibacter sp.]|nr:hypothetical protein [Phaeodactylibacter sp.]MCB9274636.1 hypothetical protein [Lewinellaceae bacterium]
MYKFLTKNGQPIAFGVGILISIIFLLVVVSNISEFTALPKEEQSTTGIFNFGLVGAIILGFIAALAMVFFGLYQIASDFKGSVKGLIGFGILLAVFLIAYFTASGEPTPYLKSAIDKFQETGGVLSANNLKFIGAGISTSVILVLAAAVAFIFSEIRNFFK